jgi:hypothetical protein
MKIRTFICDTQPPATVLAALAQRGYDVGDLEPLQRTLLDTFDGLVHRAGLRLEMDQAPSTTLRITGESVVPVSAAVRAVPRFADDLPPGPLRARLSPVIEVRALLPRLIVSGRRRAIVERDATCAVVAQAVVYEDLRAEQPEALLPSWTIEVTELTALESRRRSSSPRWSSWA